MKKMNFDIQMFNALFDYSALKSLCEKYDANVKKMDDALEANSAAMKLFVAAAASESLEASTSGIVNAMNSNIGNMVTFFGTVKGWSEWVGGELQRIFQSGEVPTVTVVLNEHVIAAAKATLEDGSRGLTDFSKAEDYMASMEAFNTAMDTTTSNMIQDCRECYKAYAEQMSEGLLSTIEESATAIQDSCRTYANYMRENAEAFKLVLQSFIDEAAAATHGGN